MLRRRRRSSLLLLLRRTLLLPLCLLLPRRMPNVAARLCATARLCLPRAACCPRPLPLVIRGAGLQQAPAALPLIIVSNHLGPGVGEVAAQLPLRQPAPPSIGGQRCTGKAR